MREMSAIVIPKGDVMKKVFCAAALLLLLAVNASAAEEQRPESITGKMAVKFGRGVVNITTAVGEIPKQTVIMGRDMGAVGYVVGPVSGIVMTMYRAIIGATEMIFFVVPAPGYYDEMIDPEFVWEGWGPKAVQSNAPPTQM
jgi:putative exosortase-associated protein (TIGR04073 family)